MGLEPTTAWTTTIQGGGPAVAGASRAVSPGTWRLRAGRPTTAAANGVSLVCHGTGTLGRCALTC
jgi:hypothetical protein